MAVSELPGNPNAVWTVRRHVEGMQYFPEAQGAHDFVCVLFVVVFCSPVQGMGMVLRDADVPCPKTVV